MKFKAVSIPAQYMALFRAIETARPCHKRLFSDPMAAAFLTPQQQWINKAAATPLLGPLVIRAVNRRRSGALSAGIARTRYIDELLERGIASGARQVLILGAGFDTRALRLDSLKNLPVIEFDLPATARFKRSVLEAAGALPRQVRYYEADFNKQDLDTLFAEKQIDTSLVTAVIWEGVTNCLTAAAINTVFRVLNTFTKGSSVIFTYIDKLVLESPRLFDATDRLATQRSDKDELRIFGFHPAELPHYLDLFGFILQEDCSACEYRRLYMPERGWLNRGYGFYRVATAIRK